MKVLIICLTVVVSIFLCSALVFAQTCHTETSKGSDTAQQVCSKTKSIVKCLGNKVVCPVMGTVFKADKKTTFHKYDGKIYYFCCPGCVDKFKANPKKYMTSEKTKNVAP